MPIKHQMNQRKRNCYKFKGGEYIAGNKSIGWEIIQKVGENQPCTGKNNVKLSTIAKTRLV